MDPKESYSNLFHTYQRIFEITGDLCSKKKGYPVHLNGPHKYLHIFGSNVSSNYCGFGENFQRIYDIISRFRSSSDFVKYIESMTEEENEIRKSKNWKSVVSRGMSNDKHGNKILSRVSFIMDQSNFLSKIASKIENLDLLKLEQLDSFFLDMQDDLSIDYKVIYFECPIIIPTGRDRKNFSTINILYSRPDPVKESMIEDHKKIHSEFGKRFDDIFIGGLEMDLMNASDKKKVSMFRFNLESLDNIP